MCRISSQISIVSDFAPNFNCVESCPNLSCVGSCSNFNRAKLRLEPFNCTEPRPGSLNRAGHHFGPQSCQTLPRTSQSVTDLALDLLSCQTTIGADSHTSRLDPLKNLAILIGSPFKKIQLFSLAHPKPPKPKLM